MNKIKMAVIAVGLITLLVAYNNRFEIQGSDDLINWKRNITFIEAKIGFDYYRLVDKKTNYYYKAQSNITRY